VTGERVEHLQRGYRKLSSASKVHVGIAKYFDRLIYVRLLSLNHSSYTNTSEWKAILKILDRLWIDKVPHIQLGEKVEHMELEVLGGYIL